MKQKISISIEEDSIDKLDECVESGKFRNKSHVIEFALNKFLEDEK
ncbi:ribbon-helix-helix protein, CopG family [Candidatus Pacearchaeota archaeon]|nr:ribbon-helix-helix protein, CopG family [Candidatus Pacearchaeota archaeon]